MSLFKSKQQPRVELVHSVSYPRSVHRSTIRPRRNAPIARRSFALPLAILGIVITGLVIFWPSHGKDKSDEASAQQVQVQKQPEPVKHLDFTTMDSSISSVITAHPSLDIGVATVDIKTGDSKTYGVENAFVAASTAKLLTAIAYLHDVEQGNNTLDEKIGTRTAQAALEAMIVESDNQAWYDFNLGVLSHEELSTYAQQIGFANYDPDKNTVTATSLAQLLSNLYQRKLLNESHTTLLLSYMQKAKEVEFITSIAPANVKVYHKPGYLSDRVHDAAILDDGKRPYVLVIFTKSRTNSYNMATGADIFHQITQATFTTFLAH